MDIDKELAEAVAAVTGLSDEAAELSRRARELYVKAEAIYSKVVDVALVVKDPRRELDVRVVPLSASREEEL